MTPHPRRPPLWLPLLLILGGCSTVGEWMPHSLGGRAATTRPERVDTSRTFIEALALMQVDSASTQAELVSAARLAAETDPTAANRLRYAAYLSLPRHPSADPVAARRLLTELLAQPEWLSAPERVVAAALLDEVEDRLVLQAEITRLRQEIASRDKDRSVTVAPKHAPADLEEISRLKHALDDAQHKLDAVTQLERSSLGKVSNPKP